MKSIVRGFFTVLLAIGWLGSLAKASAEPTIALRTSTEDGKKMLVATVTSSGKPVDNVKVAFFARRSFGALSLGAEVTLDDGTAAVPFPVTLPGDERGRLQLSAELANRPKSAPAVRVEGQFDGGLPFQAQRHEIPRALWSSRAPLVLLLNIGILVGLVWGAFAYAVVQLVRIPAASGPKRDSAFAQPKHTS